MEEAVYFLPQVPKNSCYSFYQPRKDERLSRPWSHPLVLNTGPLDRKPRAFTTRPYKKNAWKPFPFTFFVILCYFQWECNSRVAYDLLKQLNAELTMLGVAWSTIPYTRKKLICKLQETFQMDGRKNRQILTGSSNMGKFTML